MSRHTYILAFTVFCSVLFSFSAIAADASAAALPAGFAAAPIWISSASPVDGNTLKLFAVVNNASSAVVDGTVSFLVDETIVGSVKVSLAVGTAQVLSVPWTASAGAHSITATFLGTTAGPISIIVAKAPPKPVILQYLDTATNAVTSVAAPALSGTLAAIENMRKSGADYFAEQSAPVAPQPRGKVLGTTTEKIASTTPVAAAATGVAPFFNRLGYSIFNNPMLFYPAFLLFFFFMLWIILRIFSRD